MKRNERYIQWNRFVYVCFWPSFRQMSTVNLFKVAKHSANKPNWDKSVDHCVPNTVFKLQLKTRITGQRVIDQQFKVHYTFLGGCTRSYV